jgi:hypothetical protein
MAGKVTASRSLPQPEPEMKPPEPQSYNSVTRLHRQELMFNEMQIASLCMILSISAESFLSLRSQFLVTITFRGSVCDAVELT